MTPSVANYVSTRRRLAANAEESVRDQVRRFLGHMQPHGVAVERRQHGRIPFPMLVRLTPVDPVSLEPIDETIIVAGKNLSEDGLGFYHPQPLAYRRAIVNLQDHSGRTVSLLIDLSWCRFTRQGWYDSGGRFLEIVEPLHNLE
jgi:hypothetical protein